MRVLSLIFLTILLHAVAIASTQIIDQSQSGIRLIEKVEKSNSIQFSHRISPPIWKTSILNLNQQYVEISGLENIESDNLPIIPQSSRFLRLPLNGGPRIEILNAEFETFQDIDYAVFSGSDVTRSGINPGNPSAWYPENIVTASSPSILHDFRVANVCISPVQVNRLTGEVRVYSNIQYEIHFDQNDNSNSLDSWPTAISEAFLPWYRQLLDWEESELDEFALYRGNLVVVTPNSAAIMNALDPWLEWKKQKGWKIELITDDDIAWNQNSIATELRNRYEEADPKFDYVVIVGDASGAIATPPATGIMYGGGDHAYSCLAGDDDLVDVGLGRISVESIMQLNAYVNKVLSYEKEPNMDETQWYKRGLASAGSVASGISTVYTAQYAINEMELAGYDEALMTAYNDGNPVSVNDRNLDILNQGVSFHLYRGFGGTGLEHHQIEGLQNTNKLSAVIDITCGRGNWSENYGINEAYMRAGTVQSPRGAIGAISTATSHTHTKFNNALSGGAIWGAFRTQYPTMGQMIKGAKINMWKNLAVNYPQSVDDFNNWTNLMGDPSVWIWTDVPRQLTVSAALEVDLGNVGYSVLVEDLEGPVEGAWVTLYKSDDYEELVAHNVTDESGMVHLQFSAHYDGQAMLTVTAPDAQPYQMPVIVNSENCRLGFIDVNIIDDNTSGTNGNGNGIAEYGETVGLEFLLHNFVPAVVSNINLTLESDDLFVESISGTGTVAVLPGTQNSTTDTPILVDISDNTPDHWLCRLNVIMNTSAGIFTDYYNLEISSPDYFHPEVEVAQNLLPGNSADVSFTLVNHGSADASVSTLTLSSEDNWLTINNDTGTLGSINSGETATSSTFSVTAAENAFRGYPAEAALEVEFSNGRTETVPVKIRFGQTETNDPTGPDSYGYFAYDNSDIDYDLAPEYNWIEINPNTTGHHYPGIAMPLNDFGNNMDAAITLDIPFDFVYYGERYNQITVCSNGWVAMGDQQGMALQRNWTIPSPLGPSAMIAPFWDDRTLSSGSVYYYISEIEGKVIIQWDNTNDGLGINPCTFEVVLYAEDIQNPSPTGDCDILFQYETINESEGNFTDVAYSTTGIENQDQDDGLLYVYHETYEAGAVLRDDESSILFSTRREEDFGTITGTITDVSNGEELSDVYITPVSLGTTSYSDDDGEYSLHTLAGENISIFCYKDGFDPQLISNINVPVDGNVVLDIQMLPPAFSISPYEIETVLDLGETEIVDLVITNVGDRAVSYEAYVSPLDPIGNNGNIGELYESYELVEARNAGYTNGFAYDGENFLSLIGWGPIGGSQIFVYSTEGEYIQTIEMFDQYWGIQVDGDDIILANSTGLHWYHRDGNSMILDETVQIDLAGPAICVDTENEIIYHGHEEFLSALSYDGNLLHNVASEFFIASCTYVPDDPEGKTVHYVSYRNDGNFTPEIHRVNPDGTDDEYMFDLYSTEPFGYIGMDVYTLEDDTYSTIGFTKNTGASTFLDLHYYFPNIELATLSQYSGNLLAGEQENISVTLNQENLPEGIYESWIIFEHDGFTRRNIIPVIVEINSTNVEENDLIPTEWALDKIYPNPFNPSTNVQFSLLASTHVNMVLFNINGQQVKSLMNEEMKAGVHTLTIDGSSLASGLYFLQMKAGPINSTRKLMLIK